MKKGMIALVVVCLWATVWADKVYLKDGAVVDGVTAKKGTVLEGIVKAKTKDKIVLEGPQKGNFRSIRLADVENIVKGKVALDASAALRRGSETRKRIGAQERAEKRKEAARSRAQREATEVNVRGLVLLKNTVKAAASDYTGKITGIVENRTGTSIRYAEIRYGIYDKAGNQMDTAFANITNLASGQRWKFEVITFKLQKTWLGTSFRYSLLDLKWTQ